MAEGAAECVPGAEAVDDVDGEGRDLRGGAVAVDGEHARRSLFDDGEFGPGGEQRAGGGVRFALPGGDLALVEVADGDRGVGQCLPVMGAGGLAVPVLRLAVLVVPLAVPVAPLAPEHGAPVEVEDGGARMVRGARRSCRAPGAECGEGRGAAGFGAQSGAGHPEHPGGPDRVQVEFRAVDLQVGRLGLPVEVEGEIVRREDLAEGDRGRIRRHGAHPPVVHPELPQRLVEIVSEGVLAGPGDHRRAPSQPGCRHGDVGR